MNKIRVVVVDDSAFMRMIVSDMIESSNKYTVVGKFKNGAELLKEVDKINPDIITLDMEMDVMDGITTLKRLKEKNKKYPVIMLSSLTKKGSIETMKCLELGAVDFVEKASNSQRDIMKKELLSKIGGIVENKISTYNYKNVHVDKEIYRKSKIEAVVIGASTGGPKALQAVLSKIEENINVPVFVVQHMPKGFTKAFSERLNTICKLKVVEAYDGIKIEPNNIYIAKGGYHMIVIDKNKIKLSNDPAIWGVRPAVDKLFESAVQVYRGNLLSAILTGMGKDGAKGSEMIKDAGGITLSQDQATSTIYGMPKAAYETGKIDLVLSLNEIGKKISDIVRER